MSTLQSALTTTARTFPGLPLTKPSDAKYYRISIAGEALPFVAGSEQLMLRIVKRYSAARCNVVRHNNDGSSFGVPVR